MNNSSNPFWNFKALFLSAASLAVATRFLEMLPDPVLQWVLAHVVFIGHDYPSGEGMSFKELGRQKRPTGACGGAKQTRSETYLALLDDTATTPCTLAAVARSVAKNWLTGNRPKASGKAIPDLIASWGLGHLIPTNVEEQREQG